MQCLTGRRRCRAPFVALAISRSIARRLFHQPTCKTRQRSYRRPVCHRSTGRFRPVVAPQYRRMSSAPFNRICCDTTYYGSYLATRRIQFRRIRQRHRGRGGPEATAHSGRVAGRRERVGSGQRPSSVCRLVRQPYHRAVTLAAISSAIFNADSAGLALHVLMSIMTLFLSASARPQPQPGALASC
jgi:hypothetical protein